MKGCLKFRLFSYYPLVSMASPEMPWNDFCKCVVRPYLITKVFVAFPNCLIQEVLHDCSYMWKLTEGVGQRTKKGSLREHLRFCLFLLLCAAGPWLREEDFQIQLLQFQLLRGVEGRGTQMLHRQALSLNHTDPFTLSLVLFDPSQEVASPRKRYTTCMYVCMYVCNMYQL